MGNIFYTVKFPIFCKDSYTRYPIFSCILEKGKCTDKLLSTLTGTKIYGCEKRDKCEKNQLQDAELVCTIQCREEKKSSTSSISRTVVRFIQGQKKGGAYKHYTRIL